MSEHQRFNLDDAVNEPRQGIDANWTRGRRIGVGALCVLIAGAAIGGGYYAWSSSRPIDLPRSAHDAVRVMASERFDRLPADRRAQYAEEASRLLRDLSWDERMKLMEQTPQAMRAMFEARFDDMAYRVARGEEVSFEPPERREPTDEERERWREMRERWENMTPEERREEMQQRMTEMRNQMNQRTAEAFNSGNGQTSALRGEMFKNMRRGGGAPGRGPGGGGRPGGR